MNDIDYNFLNNAECPECGSEDTEWVDVEKFSYKCNHCGCFVDENYFERDNFYAQVETLELMKEIENDL